MRKILIINPYYFPGYRSGGPQQTFVNVIEAYGDEFKFYVLTLNHDMGSTEAYTDINDDWNGVGKAMVKYLPDSEYAISAISKTAGEMDLIYAGGFFEKTTIKAMAANMLNKIKCPLWVAPMGVFSDGAFNHKRLKKELFVIMGKMIGLFRNIRWSFTSDMELNDFIKHIGKPNEYEIASDIPRKIENHTGHAPKKEGALRIIFLSRICPKKNLTYAIEVVSRLTGNIIFDIYGTREDQSYWKLCEEKLGSLPGNISWHYKGEVEGSRVIDVFSDYDVFLFPTLGENFGHVIYEALAAGCVPVISDTTPWADFDDNKCGSIASLQDNAKFKAALQNFIEMDNNEFKIWRFNATKKAEQIYKDSVEQEGYRRIFSIG